MTTATPTAPVATPDANGFIPPEMLAAGEVAEAIPESIFKGKVNLWSFYKVTAQFRNRVMGATPKNPKTMSQWLRAKLGTDDEEELRNTFISTLLSMGWEGGDLEKLNFEELVKVSEKMAGDNANGFKRHPTLGLYLEGRVVKAMLRECVNILYAGERWGLTNKGPKSYAVERVFVMEDIIPLGRFMADGLDQMFGHVQTPQGPRSTVGLSEYCFQPTITYHLMVQNVQARTKDQKAADAKRKAKGDSPLIRQAIDPELWPTILSQGEEIGLGALRSQGHGRYNTIGFEEVTRDVVPVCGADAIRTAGIILSEAPEPPSIPEDPDDEGDPTPGQEAD